MGSLERMATITASTKRTPAPVAGVTGDAAQVLASVKILPLMPVTPEIQTMYRINSPRESYVTYTDGMPDIQEGDELYVSTVKYHVTAVGPWAVDHSFLEVIVQKVKGS